ncbi:GntR family transcriptional regulator [Kosmotoga pacifica]|uniref:GntR family transcriptional regulator n=1 Tax=Kosmotoga pacifica TaxID=1330330 RepID=A0A0G2Z7M4_9BACT|nr:GntR family transcriptional regulator [Kosmotoga pacifica]AKI97547.1 GntR family transcriptional regulator [Kosmotoga pacifica]
MLIKLDIHSAIPIYEQIKLAIIGKILKGELKRDDVLPSIRELASSLRVNPNTVVKAYKELELEGILIARQGIGFLVNSERSKVKEGFLMGLKKELAGTIKSAKRNGVSLEELMEVVFSIWNETK